jgi:hypothetical protein
METLDGATEINVNPGGRPASRPTPPRRLLFSV